MAGMTAITNVDHNWDDLKKNFFWNIMNKCSAVAMDSELKQMQNKLIFPFSLDK